MTNELLVAVIGLASAVIGLTAALVGRHRTVTHRPAGPAGDRRRVPVFKTACAASVLAGVALVGFVAVAPERQHEVWGSEDAPVRLLIGCVMAFLASAMLAVLFGEFR